MTTDTPRAGQYTPQDIAADGYPHNADRIHKDARPPIPHKATRFQRNYGYVPATVIYWSWSVDFGRYGALVEYEDGERCYTWPERVAA